MTAAEKHDAAVEKARTVLKGVIEAARLEPFTAMAVFAAAEGYAKMLQAAHSADHHAAQG